MEDDKRGLNHGSF